MAKHIETIARDLAVTAVRLGVEKDASTSWKLNDRIYRLECEIAAAPALDAADAAVKLMIAHERAERILLNGLPEIREDAAAALALATQTAGAISPDLFGAADDTAGACRLLSHILGTGLAPDDIETAARGAAVLLAQAVLVLERDAGVPVRKLGGDYYLTPHFTPAAVRCRKRMRTEHPANDHVPSV